MWKICLAALTMAVLVSANEVVVLNPSNFDTIVKDANKDVFVKFYAPWCGHCVRMADAWKELASGYDDASNVVIAELDADAHGSTASAYGVSGFPTIKLFLKNDKSGKDYDGRRDTAAFKAFLQKNGAGGAAGEEPAAPAAESGSATVTPGEVAVLNPSNFDAIVKDSNKNVFVKFYAPWCGHCVRMADAWKELAKNTAGSDVVIAELDADAHGDTARAFGVRGFPTLKYFPKSDKSGDVAYRGGRDLASFTNFLKEQGVQI
jgi:protein disulfide-isomerase-like protein